MKNLSIELDEISALVDTALAEDIGRGDLTTKFSVPRFSKIDAIIVARENLILSGVPVVKAIFSRLEPDAVLDINKCDGSEISKNDIIIRIQGIAEGVLTAERTALNILQFLSGIATLTGRYVREIEGTKAVLLDTRKTIPGLRSFSKYAVRCGGAKNHRMRLDDGILIKDNHIYIAGGIAEAINSAKKSKTVNLPIQVECDNLQQVKIALETGVDSLLLDNMIPEKMRQAVTIVAGKIPIEASGGITLETIRTVAETGVDFISVGAITQRASSVDIGLDIA